MQTEIMADQREQYVETPAFELQRLRSLQAIVNRSRAMVFVWRVADGWAVDYCTDNVSQLGYTADDFLSGRVRWQDITHPLDAPRLQQEVEGYLEKGVASFSQTYRLYDAEGGLRWMEDETMAVRNSEGVITHFEGLVVDVTERVAAEQALRASEGRYRQLLDQLADGVVSVGRDGAIEEVNERLCEMVGMGRDELVGRDLRECVQRLAPNAKPLRLAEVMRGEEVRATREVRSKDGRELSVESRTRRLPDGRVLSVLRDVTDRMRAERALRESEENFRALVDNAGEAIFIEAQDGHILYANAEGARLTGYEREELIGLSTRAVTAEEDRDRVAEYTHKRFRGEDVPMPYTAHVLARNGDRIPVEVTGARTVWKGKPATIGMLRDIRERLRALQALRESEANLARAQQIARLGSWEWDLESKRLNWSDALYRLRGLEAGSFQPTYEEWIESIHPDDRQRAIDATQALVRGPEGRVISVEYRARRIDGTWIVLAVQGEVVTDPGTGRLRAVGTAQDVTDRKRTEVALARSHNELQRLTRHLQEAREAERAHIAREIHDEMGQSLTALKMDLHWLASKVSGEKRLAQRTRAMIEIADATVQTVKRLSSELKPALLEDEGLEAAVRWHLDQFAKRYGVVCDASIDVDRMLSVGLRTAVFRVFQEATTNVARHAAAKRLSVCLYEKADRLYLKIHDNGRGLARTDKVRSGAMGLIGMRERVHERGGRIRVSGRPGRGTSIVCWFPLDGVEDTPVDAVHRDGQ